jgi:NDP-sugar pyrophosphorylase family protein
MKAVILAAGHGTRMKHLTDATPKPLLLYEGKPLIEHKLEALPEKVTKVVIVVGYLGEQIKNYFGNEWNTKKIQYVEQSERLGTAHALYLAKDLLDRPFLVLMGDDIYGKDDLELLSNQEDWAILVEAASDNGENGRVMMEEETSFKNFLYTGACMLTPEIFKLAMIPIAHEVSGAVKEFGLPQTLAQAATTRPIKIYHSIFWKRITAPEDLK